MGLFSGIGDTIGGLAGGLTGAGGADAAKDAARAQVEALTRAIQENRAGYNAQNDIWGQQRGLGMGAMNQLFGLYGISAPGSNLPYYGTDGKLVSGGGAGAGGYTQAGAPDFSAFFNSPDYQYARDQSLDAVDSRAGAMGNLFSGARAGALEQKAGDLASQNFGNYFNRLSGLSGFGTQANSALSGLLDGTTQRIADARIQAGIARAGGKIGAANSYGTAAGNLMNFASSMWGGGGGINAGGGAYGSGAPQVTSNTGGGLLDWAKSNGGSLFG